MKTVKIAHRGERVGYIDAIRGFAILLVVLGHILNIVEPETMMRMNCYIALFMLSTCRCSFLSAE